MIDLTIDKYKVKVPENWNELTGSQVRWLANRFHHIIKPSYEFQIRVFLRLINIRFWQFQLQYKIMNASDMQIVLLSDLAQPFVALDKLNLTNNKFKRIRIFGKLYLGPDDSLRNLSIAEFSFADKFFANYLKTNEEEWLDKLCATLYRSPMLFRKNKMLDQRKIFNSYSINNDSKAFRNVKFIDKISILFFYWGCRNLLEQTFTHIFDPKNEQKQKQLDLGWISVILDLSGDKFGTLKETEESPMWLIFTYIENELIKSLTKKQH